MPLDDENIFAGGLADRSTSLMNQPGDIRTTEEKAKDDYDILTRLVGSVPGLLSGSDIFNMYRDASGATYEALAKYPPVVDMPFMTSAIQPIDAPTEELPPFEERPLTTEWFQQQMGGDPHNPMSMMGDALSMFTQPEVFALKALPLIAGVSKAKKGIESLDTAKQSTQGIGALDETKRMLQEQVNTFARNENFVSPSISVMIKAPRNLKGQGILQYLNKNAKPKELEHLGLDEFIKNNPNATMDDAIQHASENQVRINKDYRFADADRPSMEFTSEVSDADPLDGSSLWGHRADDIRYDINKGNNKQLKDDSKQLILDHYNNVLTKKPDILAMTDRKAVLNPDGSFRNYSSDTLTRRINKELPVKVESFDDIPEGLVDEIIEEISRNEYYDNPYQMIKPNVAGDNFGDGTFAYGNDDTGYSIFVDGNRIDPPTEWFQAGGDVPYSRAEAEIQLRDAIVDTQDTDPYRLAGEVDDFGDDTYKGFIDQNLPGGSEYREVSINWDNADVTHDLVHSGLNNDGQNILHALVRIRKLDDGTYTLHIDELQSDLHQQGSKRGYKLPEKTIIEEVNKIEKFLEGTGQTMKPPESLQIDTLVDSVIFVRDGDTFLGAFPLRDIKYLSQYLKEGITSNFGSFKRDAIVKTLGKEKVIELADLVKPLVNQGDVPNYPYKDDWHKLGLKQMLLEAIQNGNDAISTSPAKVFSERYSGEYEKFYTQLYDQKIPAEMKRLAKKYGGKFEKGSLDLEDTYGAVNAKSLERMPLTDPRRSPNRASAKANILKITPEMKEKILAEGLESFAKGGLVQSIDIFGDN